MFPILIPYFFSLLVFVSFGFLTFKRSYLTLIYVPPSLTVKLYIVPTQCIYVLRVILKTSSHYLPIVVGLSNGGKLCSLWGRNWISKLCIITMIPKMHHTHLNLNITSLRRTSGRSLWTSADSDIWYNCTVTHCCIVCHFVLQRISLCDSLYKVLTNLILWYWQRKQSHHGRRTCSKSQQHTYTHDPSPNSLSVCTLWTTNT